VDGSVDDPRHDGQGDKVEFVEESGQWWHYIRAEGSFEVSCLISLVLEVVERQYQIFVNTSDREKDSKKV
jgi:hypothetical protein